jgi:hypothetical protein
LGPGSYNITDKLLHRKPIAHKIPPEPKKRVVEEEAAEVNIPTVGNSASIKLNKSEMKEG